jgi:hypothetical protein
LRIAEESGDNFTVGFARFSRGLALVGHGGPDSAQGLSRNVVDDLHTTGGMFARGMAACERLSRHG